MFIVYILYSKSISKFYCGSTSNFEDRFDRHNAGRSKYTKRGIPWVLVHRISCSSRSEAVRLETKIKKRGIRRFLTDSNISFGV